MAETKKDSKKSTAQKYVPLEKRTMTTMRYRDEDEAEGITITKRPNATKKNIKTTKKTK